MSASADIFEAMRRSGMNDWVGGGDPAFIGRNNFACVLDNLSLRPSDRVLDFGCGIGRTSVPLAEFLVTGELVGIDVIPAQIRFCQAEIASRFRNASFYCTDARNPQYDPLIVEDNIAVSEDEFWKSRTADFDLVIAYSVFTHFDPTMISKYLSCLKKIIKAGGYIFLSWFFDHHENPPEDRISSGEKFRNIDNLFKSLFSLELFEDLVADAGLQIQRITFGTWRGGADGILKGQHYQDISILYRAAELPADFDPVRYLELNQDVAAAGADPARHYLDFGYREGRRLR